MLNRQWRMGLVFVLALMAGGCAATSINQVLADPGKYRNDTITVRGTVTDSASVGADQRPVLQRQAQWLAQYRQVQAVVEGHADERGTREYNLALGQRRANAARDLLVSGGVAGSRLRTISYGKDRPAELGSDEQAWARNRRAVTTVQ